MGIKRSKMQIECECCGDMFMQTRWWQVYCSLECKKKAEKTAKATLKKVLPELEYLRNKVKELENNALAHSETRIVAWEDD